MPAFFLGESPSDTARRDVYVPYRDSCCTDSLYLPSLYFDTHSAALRPASLARAVPLLRQYTSPAAQAHFALVVVGHAEPGEVPRNHPEPGRYLRALALQRALNTGRYLRAQGLARQHLYVISRGDQQPKLPNTSPEYRQLNRRVEFRLRYLPDNPVLDPAAAYDALVPREAKGAAGPKASRGHVVPARGSRKATK
jgi:outer membrane protein OmpA-like peptidoglycan-associated protein